MAALSTFVAPTIHPFGDVVTVADSTKINEVTNTDRSGRFSFFPVGNTGYLTWTGFGGIGTQSDGGLLPAKYLTLPANQWTSILFNPRHLPLSKYIPSFFLGASVNGTAIQVLFEDDTPSFR